MKDPAHPPVVPPGRAISCEVFVENDGRWLIDCVIEAEEAAIARARQLLKDENNSAVRVVRHRTVRATGFTTQTIAFEQQQAPRAKKEIGISGTLDRATHCTKLEELYGLDARIIINRLLREFLNNFLITPTELLHQARYIKRLDANGNLMTQVIGQVARAQGDVHGKLRERVDVLGKLVDAGIRLARESEKAAAQLAPPEPGKFAAFLAAVQAKAEPARWRYLAFVALANHVDGTPSWGAKFEKIAALLSPDLDPEAQMMLDGMLADILFTRTMMEEVIGPQRNLADALSILADLALRRRGPERRHASEPFKLLEQLVYDYGLPVCRVIIVDRIRSELKSNKPLDRKDPAGERYELYALRQRLTDSAGQIVGGKDVESLLELRAEREY